MLKRTPLSTTSKSDESSGAIRFQHLPKFSAKSEVHPGLERWRRWLDGSIFFFLCLFAILLPHSIKGSQHAWQIALVLWLVKLAVVRERPFPQPLTAPLLAYVVFSAVSTILSPDPYVSWVQMKFVCLVIVGIVFAQNLNRLSQVRILVFLLLLSGLAAAGFTAWQYSFGIGVQVKQILPKTGLYRAGIRPDDIITRVNGQSVHSAAQLERAVDQNTPGTILRIDFLRGSPLGRRSTFLAREGFRDSGLGKPDLQLVRGKPVRAQGTLRHYGVFAETLMPIGCLAWAMLLCAQPQRPALRALFAVIFLALAMTIVATQTRRAVAGLAAGCFVALLLLAGRRARVSATAALGVLLLAATFWIQHTRGLNWIAVHDAGTQYRVLMWQDGLRLVRQHPWFGVGMGTIFNHWQEWNIRAYALYHVQWHFHSDFVQLAVERGLPALAAWVWFLVANLIFLVGLLRRVRTRSRFAAGVVTGVLAGFVAFLLSSLVEYTLIDETLVMLLFSFFGMAVAIDHMLGVSGAIDVP
jgi:O-antigen ligase/polysaccharide polymerase Wzy-like membrane protein/PDZ domain-containing protein